MSTYRFAGKRSRQSRNISSLLDSTTFGGKEVNSLIQGLTEPHSRHQIHQNDAASNKLQGHLHNSKPPGSAPL